MAAAVLCVLVFSGLPPRGHRRITRICEHIICEPPKKNWLLAPGAVQVLRPQPAGCYHRHPNGEVFRIMGEEKPFPSKRLAPPRAAASWEDVGSDRTFRWKRRPLGPLVDNCGRRPGEQHVTPAVASFPGVDPPTGDDPSWASGKGPATPRGRVQVFGNR